MSSPDSGEQSPEIDPTIRMMKSEFELGIDCNHVFGQEPISQQPQNRASEERTTMIVEFDEDGVHVEFEEPDGTRHP